MTKVLIIANALNRANVFLPIADQLIDMGARVSFVSLDLILGGGASKALKKAHHPFVELPNPSDDYLFEIPRSERFKTLREIAPSVKEILKSTQPDILVLGAASYVEDIFLNEALKAGIKTALMQDGLRIYQNKTAGEKLIQQTVSYITSVINEWTRALYGVSYFFSPFETNRVDRILLFGNAVIDRMARKGVMREKLVAVGNPLYDSAKPTPRDHAYKIRDFFGIPPKKPVVLFGMQCFHKHDILSLESEIKIVSDLVEFFRDFENIDLIIKLHPENDYSLYQERFNNFNPPNNVHLVKDEFTPQELLGTSTVFMTVYSTMALEALVNGVPVITLDFTDVRHFLELEPAGFSAKSEKDLRDLFSSDSWDQILKLKLKEHRDEILDNELVHLGFAAEKAAEEILLLSQKNDI